MQVASMAASMGAFSGAGALGAAKAGGAAGSGTEGGAAAITGTDPSSTFDIGMDLDLGTGANTFGESMVGPEAYTHGGSFTFDTNTQGGSFTGNTPGVMPASPVMSAPNNTTQLQTTPFNSTDPQFNPNSDLQKTVFEATQAYSEGNMPEFNKALEQLPEPIPDGMGGPSLPDSQLPIDKQYHGENAADRARYDRDMALYGDAPVASGNQGLVGGNPTVKPKPTQTTQQPDKPPATKTPVKPEVKPEPPKTEGPGPGGKEKGFWDDKPFNLKNALEFLQTPEGLKWLNSDKGLAGLGRKLSAAADAGVSGTGGLTPEERKKIYARLKKEREERKKKRRGDDDK
jgi:hypothetical protein